jgi:hypothetical protein
MPSDAATDLGNVGTSVMVELDSARSGILFPTRHLKECVVAENEEDRIDTLIRNWEFTAKQACEARAWPGRQRNGSMMRTPSTSRPWLMSSV